MAGPGCRLDLTGACSSSLTPRVAEDQVPVSLFQYVNLESGTAQRDCSWGSRNVGKEVEAAEDLLDPAPR